MLKAFPLAFIVHHSLSRSTSSLPLVVSSGAVFSWMKVFTSESLVLIAGRADWRGKISSKFTHTYSSSVKPTSLTQVCASESATAVLAFSQVSLITGAATFCANSDPWSNFSLTDCFRSSHQSAWAKEKVMAKTQMKLINVGVRHIFRKMNRIFIC